MSPSLPSVRGAGLVRVFHPIRVTSRDFPSTFWMLDEQHFTAFSHRGARLPSRVTHASTNRGCSFVMCSLHDRLDALKPRFSPIFSEAKAARQEEGGLDVALAEKGFKA